MSIHVVKIQMRFPCASLGEFDRVFGDARYRRELLEQAEDEIVVRFWRQIATRAGPTACRRNAAVLPADVHTMRTFDAAPVICQQSNQHRTELAFVIKWLLYQMISFASCCSPRKQNRHSFD